MEGKKAGGQEDRLNTLSPVDINHSTKNHPTLTFFYGASFAFAKKNLSQNATQSFCSAESVQGGNNNILSDNSYSSNPPFLHTSPFGFLNIYKPAGMTSHDVVAVLRKNLKIKQIGHTGTLDPFAEGVLPIAISKATRLIEYLPDDKEYLATVQFGKSTNTYDLDGETTFTSDKKVTENEILEKLKDFEGEIEQFPPIFSAIKVKGKKLYEYARKGEEVQIQPRKVVIYNIELKSFDFELQQAQILIKCSKGTYIRSIANDLGEKLRVGGHLIKLIRTQAGKFRVEDSITLENINVEKNIINPVEMLDLPIVEVDDEDLEKIKNGVSIEAKQLGSQAANELEDKKVRGLEDKLFNDSSLNEISQKPQIDNAFSPYRPNALLPFVLLVYNEDKICAVGQTENDKIKLKKVFL